MMQRLQEAIFSKKAPIVVGLDPQLSFIPTDSGTLSERVRGDAGGGGRGVLSV